MLHDSVVPTSRVYPLQFRKIWKKLFLLEITASASSYKLWRSIFGSLLALGGVFVVFGSAFPQEKEVDFTPYFAFYLLLLFGFIFFVVLYEWLYIWTYYYDVGPDFLRIRKGVIVRTEIGVPFNHIQDVYIDQDFMDHLFHLYDVHISTASHTSGAEAHIDGLNHTNAEKIQEMILTRIKESSEPKSARG